MYIKYTTLCLKLTIPVVKCQHSEYGRCGHQAKKPAADIRHGKSVYPCVHNYHCENTGQNYKIDEYPVCACFQLIACRFTVGRIPAHCRHGNAKHSSMSKQFKGVSVEYPPVFPNNRSYAAHKHSTQDSKAKRRNYTVFSMRQ